MTSSGYQGKKELKAPRDKPQPDEPDKSPGRPVKSPQKPCYPVQSTAPRPSSNIVLKIIVIILVIIFMIIAFFAVRALGLHERLSSILRSKDKPAEIVETQPVIDEEIKTSESEDADLSQPVHQPERRLYPSDFRASGIYPSFTTSDGHRYSYEPENVYDGDRLTSWGTPTGEWRGAWIEFEFDRQYEITKIRVIPGLDRDDKYWDGNHRLKTAWITFDSRNPIEHTFSDSRTMQTVVVDPPVKARCVRVKVVSVYRGNVPRYDELLISEMEVWCR